MRPWTFASALVIAAALSRAASAQAPASAEFRVNEVTTGSQWNAAVAAHDGGFVVAWGGPDASGTGIFARRYDASGNPIGAEFQVNTVVAQDQYLQGRPGAAAAPDGRFVVVWESPAGLDSEVFARVFDAAGAPVGAEFQVNTYTPGAVDRPSVAMAADGSFMVAWEAPRFFPFDVDNLRGRVFGAGGVPLTPEFLVPSYNDSREWGAALAAVRGGGYVVAWSGEVPDSNGWDSFARRFDAAGDPIGAQFRIGTQTFNSQQSPVVAVGADGTFLLVYDQDGPGDFIGIHGQFYDPSGNPRTQVFRVNRTVSGPQGEATAAFDRDGNAFVAWASSDGDGFGVYGQLLDPDGRFIGPEWRVNTYTPFDQRAPSVSVDADGRMAIAWTSYFQDGSGSGIYAQRLGPLRPLALAVDSAGNGVAEPGESVAVAPVWRNTGAAPTTPSGLASGFGGPAPGVYTLIDDSAAYGTLAAGTEGGCAAAGDCYAISASASPRPSTHWDAQFTETLSTGHHWVWTLHLGDSFTDVPRSSPFYRFVETLLHYRVTGGCTPDQFCPAHATSRQDMAVFVLVAREQGDYAPAPCATPVFADVPASSPYCRWVEELVRRQVVSGCGGGNYCPLADVTREQMAVFVLRTLDPALNPPACTTPLFADVPASSPFCRWIEELARRQVVSGCGGGNYCPTQPVSREQMGVFLGVTFGLALYGP